MQVDFLIDPSCNLFTACSLPVHCPLAGGFAGGLGGGSAKDAKEVQRQEREFAAQYE